MRVHEVASILGVEPTTVRAYCNRGLLPCSRTPGGQRYFTLKDIQAFREKMGETAPTDRQPETAFYVRSSSGDKNLIQSQIDELTQAFGPPAKIYKDSASGLNEKRPGLKQLIKDATARKYTRICATYQDRLTRFGFSYLKELLEQNGAKVNILHDKQKYSMEQELMDDFMSLIASFSGRFYRMRGYNEQRKLLAAAEENISSREGEDVDG